MYIITSKTRNRIRRNPVEYGKVIEEKRQAVKELGVHRVIPSKGVSIEKAYDDILRSKSASKDKMARRSEIDLKKKNEKRKANVRPFKETEKLYLKQKADEGKRQVANNRIVI